jgi:prepilin-type N-terminal cleavage/methylation domain-containing protein
MRILPEIARRARRSERGFSLVELMVSATVLGLATIGALSMIGTGRALDAEEVFRRQAYQFAAAALEDAKYGYQNYPLAAGTTNRAIQLQIDGGQKVNATLISTVGAEQNTDLQAAPPAGGTIPIPYQQVTVKVRWPTASPTDSVSFSKWVANAQ